MKGKILLLSLFLSLVTIGLKAQDHFDFAIIKLNFYRSGSTGIIVATIEQTTETATGKNTATAYTSLLKKVNEFVGNGWEVYSNTDVTGVSGTTATTYYLRKKK